MTRDRWFHLLTFVVAALAVVLQAALVIRGHHVLDEADRIDPGTRVIRFCSYLTIWGNVIVAGSALALALGRRPESRWARALRLDAVVLIAVVGVVHFLFLRPLLDLHGSDWVADKLLHMVVPVLGVLGWVLFGPRARSAWADLPLFLVVPVAWLVYTLVRGEIVEWYPYPFIDVNEHGYGVVLLNCSGVAALMTALFAGAVWLDGRLSRSRRAA